MLAAIIIGSMSIAPPHPAHTPVLPATPGTHSGTPGGITPEFDCKARTAAWKFGQRLLPERGSFSTLFDALQLEAICGSVRPSAQDAFSPPTFVTPPGSIFVDAHVGADDHEGTVHRPLRSLEAAVALARGRPNATVVLREGVHRVPRTINLTAATANLTVQNFEGERAAVSGSLALSISPNAWRPYKIGTGQWVVSRGANLVWGRAVAKADRGPVKFLGVLANATSCQAAASANSAFAGFAYHDRTMVGFERMCFGVDRDAFTWETRADAGVTSGYLDLQNTWVADVSNLALTSQIVGLRRDGQRAIRSRFPNGNPELSGDWLEGAGQVYMYMHACSHPHTCTHASMHAYTHTYAHIRTRFVDGAGQRMGDGMHTYMHACIHTCMHTYGAGQRMGGGMHTYMHAYTHTYMHAHIRGRAEDGRWRVRQGVGAAECQE